MIVGDNRTDPLEIHIVGESETYKIERLEAAQFPLVNRFYQTCGYSVRCGRQEVVVCLRLIGDGSSTIVAAARFLPHVDGYYVLRNLCVAAQQRRKGLATYLLRNALTCLGENLCYCYAFSYLRDFYQSLGFVVRSPTQVPEQIARSYQSYCHKHRDLLLMSFGACLNLHTPAP